MPANPGSLTITDRYRASTVALRDQSGRALAAGWGQFDPYDLERSWRAWVPAAVAVVIGAQRQAVLLSDRYLAAFVSSELGEGVGPAGLDPTHYAGATAGGADLTSALRGSLVHARLASAQGLAINAILAAGATAALRTGFAETMAASRQSLTDGMSRHHRIDGWERVTSSTACGACLGMAAMGPRRTGDGIEVHGSCRCTAEPIVTGVDSNVSSRLAPAEQLDALDEDGLTARFGQEKAQLLADGDIDISDLVTRRTYGGQTYITETPASALTAG